jgi:cytochrome c oxidase subunit 2
MDGQLLISIAQGLLLVILALTVVNLYLIFRYKEIDPFAKWNPDGVNGGLFMAFFVVGLIAAAMSTEQWFDKLILVTNPASAHGEEIDRMFWNTMWVTILVVVVTNFLLFYYSWRYRYREGTKALFYPHNNRLEVVWTVVPAVVLALLVFDGVGVWHDIMGNKSKDSLLVELNGKQFDWTIRYPGEDLEFGETAVNYIDEGNSNTLGFNFEDKRGHDDLVAFELHVPVDTDVELQIRSRDVLHSATLPHFRVKMDAVPGMMTSFNFRPTKTTAEMREITGNPDFNYEMSCQQICGGGHWNMRRVVVVETMEEYQAWLKQQKPFYAQWKEMNGEPSTGGTAAAETAPADEAAESTAAVATDPKPLSMNR